MAGYQDAEGLKVVTDSIGMIIKGHADLPANHGEWLKIFWIFAGKNSYKMNAPRAIELAKQSTHPDARFLASLFVGHENVSPQGVLERLAEVCKDPKKCDPRAAFLYIALISEYIKRANSPPSHMKDYDYPGFSRELAASIVHPHSPDLDQQRYLRLLWRAAGLTDKGHLMGDHVYEGYYMAKGFFARHAAEEENERWLPSDDFTFFALASHDGDPDACVEFAHRIRSVTRNIVRAEELLAAGARLGHANAQFIFCRVGDPIINHFEDPFQAAKWLIDLLVSSVSEDRHPTFDLPLLLQCYGTQTCALVNRWSLESARVLFRLVDTYRKTNVSGLNESDDDYNGPRAASQTAYWFYSQEVGQARDACMTWVLCAKRMGMHRDTRGMIARMLWQCRWEVPYYDAYGISPLVTREYEAAPLTKKAKTE